MLLDDLPGREQAEPGPLARPLRAEERREDLLVDLVVDPGPVVGHLEDQRRTVVAGANHHLGIRLVAGLAGVEGVRDEVDEAGVDALLVHERGGDPGLGLEAEPDPGHLRLVLEQRHDLPRHLVGVHEVHGGSATAGELEELLHEGRDPGDVLLEHLPSLEHPLVVALRHPALEGVHAALQPHQDVLDAVGEAGDGLSHRRQALGGELLAFQLLGAPQVEGDRRAAEVARVVEDRHPRELHRDRVAGQVGDRGVGKHERRVGGGAGAPKRGRNHAAGSPVADARSRGSAPHSFSAALFISTTRCASSITTMASSAFSTRAWRNRWACCSCASSEVSSVTSRHISMTWVVSPSPWRRGAVDTT